MTSSLKPLVALLLLLLTMAQISCNDNDNENDDDSNSDCENTVCTLEFRNIIVSVKDQNQNPVALDSFEVINIQNGTDMTISLSSSEIVSSTQLGQYPLVNDNSLGVNQERQIRFKGFINNQEVISSTYTVSTDCCHISLDSGDLELTF
ncbi:hypothetical protein [uncultured Aquimarina sp.]|uniref:hypothetical protein n=1 Tax=uncultured Aquimarina sp. TaxID=575652 RepID=UPI00260C0B6D|nr:hypothetical protein [uncultured Aquimarina sp.]